MLPPSASKMVWPGCTPLRWALLTMHTTPCHRGVMPVSSAPLYPGRTCQCWITFTAHHCDQTKVQYQFCSMSITQGNKTYNWMVLSGSDHPISYLQVVDSNGNYPNTCHYSNGCQPMCPTDSMLRNRPPMPPPLHSNSYGNLPSNMSSNPLYSCSRAGNG